MSSPSFDVIVAGIGAMGSAACAHPARRNLRVPEIPCFGLDTFSLARLSA